MRTLKLEEDTAILKNAVEKFKLHCAKKIEFWQEKIKAYKKSGKRVITWGSGSKGAAFLSTLGLKNDIDYLVDINPFRYHKFIPGTLIEILPPESCLKKKPDVVIVMNPVYKKEVAGMLSKIKLSPLPKIISPE